MSKIFFLLFFCSSCWAWSAQLSTSISQEYQSFYQASDKQSRYYTKTTLQQKGEFEIFSPLTFKLDHTLFYTKIDRDEKNYYDLSGDRFGLNYAASAFDFFLGSFTWQPEGPDLNNLFDVVNAKDLRQPFQSKPIGSLGALFNGQFDQLNLQLFYFPKMNKSRWPSLESMWWPRTQALPISNAEGTFKLPENITYNLKSENEFEKPFDNAIGAFTKYSFSQVDLYGFYFSGPQQIPFIFPEFNIDITSLDPLVGDIQPPIELNLTWYRSDHTGLGMGYVLDSFIFKAFYKEQKDKLAVEKKSTSATFTIEHSLSLGSKTLRYFLQSNRTWKPNTASELQTLMGFFDKSSALGFFMDLEKYGSFTGAAIYNEDKGGTLSVINYEYRFTDQFKTKLTLNDLSPSNDLVGQAYSKTDTAAISFTYDLTLY